MKLECVRKSYSVFIRGLKEVLCLFLKLLIESRIIFVKLEVL